MKVLLICMFVLFVLPHFDPPCPAIDTSCWRGHDTPHIYCKRSQKRS